MRAPNFFVVGAPKCGTTAMCSYLAEHPEVFFARKEIHFFAPDVVRVREAQTWDDYLQLFDGAGPQHRVVGDASVYYLYGNAGPRIHGRVPDARILVMLRNPIELVASLHLQLLYSHNENEPDLESAWRLQAARSRGEKIPSTCLNPATLQYAKVAQLGSQVRALLASFPREQVKLVLYDDFRADPRRTYEEVLAFLDLPSDGRRSFPQVNVRKRDRVRWLGRILKRSPFGIWRKFKRVTGVEARLLKRLVLRLNSVRVEPERMPAALREEMLGQFGPEIDALSEILGRDLSHWKQDHAHGGVAAESV